MHVIIATDGSKPSLEAARHFTSFADPAKVDAVSVVAVVRPLAAVSFADDLSVPGNEQGQQDLSFRAAAQSAARVIADELAAWGPPVHIDIRSGSPATEIIKAADEAKAGLIVVASGGRGLSDLVLVGSTAQRVQHYASCPVLVVRPTRRPRATRRRSRVS